MISMIPSILRLLSGGVTDIMDFLSAKCTKCGHTFPCGRDFNQHILKCRIRSKAAAEGISAVSSVGEKEYPDAFYYDADPKEESHEVESTEQYVTSNPLYLSDLDASGDKSLDLGAGGDVLQIHWVLFCILRNAVRYPPPSSDKFVSYE